MRYQQTLLPYPVDFLQHILRMPVPLPGTILTPDTLQIPDILPAPDTLQIPDILPAPDTLQLLDILSAPDILLTPDTVLLIQPLLSCLPAAPDSSQILPPTVLWQLPACPHKPPLLAFSYGAENKPSSHVASPALFPVPFLALFLFLFLLCLLLPSSLQPLSQPFLPEYPSHPPACHTQHLPKTAALLHILPVLHILPAPHILPVLHILSGLHILMFLPSDLNLYGYLPVLQL